MKAAICALSLMSLVSFSAPISGAFAQSVGVKDIPADENTTIRIEKGVRSSEDKFEVVTNKDEIEGESAPLMKEAKENWNQACKEWKKETKELHKENQIVALNCGKRTCTTTAMESSCHSEGVSKIKVRVK
jgi:hypothetical protein